MSARASENQSFFLIFFNHRSLATKKLFGLVNKAQFPVKGQI